MSEIKFVVGDATYPIGEGKKIICHICNDVRGWGSGFVLAVSKRWDGPEKAYRMLPESEMTLGKIMIVPVEDDIMVANMIAQRGKKTEFSTQPPIRYGALRVCLANVNDFAYRMRATLHMPRIGTDRAGGKWEEVEKIIRAVMSVDVTVYDLEPKKNVYYSDGQCTDGQHNDFK